MKILFLCSGSSSCRSMMAEAILKDMDISLDVFSAGLHPEPEVDPFAVQVMHEIGIDISTNEPANFQKFEGMQVDYLITLCEGTKDKITSINKTNCSEEEIVYMYRNIRDEIKNELEYFFSRILEREAKMG